MFEVLLRANGKKHNLYRGDNHSLAIAAVAKAAIEGWFHDIVGGIVISTPEKWSVEFKFSHTETERSKS